ATRRRPVARAARPPTGRRLRSATVCAWRRTWPSATTLAPAHAERTFGGFRVAATIVPLRWGAFQHSKRGTVWLPNKPCPRRLADRVDTSLADGLIHHRVARSGHIRLGG